MNSALGSVLFACLLQPARGFAVNSLRPVKAASRCSVQCGLFDGLAKAFENKDYSNSPATYAQTNAKASHILVDSEEQANDIKAKLEDGSLDFAGAASEFSKCPSAARGGKLGKFAPGKMVKEFDDIVFGLYDTGKLNPRNEAAVFEPKYAVDVVHGPVKTKEGFHLIKIESRALIGIYPMPLALFEPLSSTQKLLTGRTVDHLARRVHR